MQETGLRLLIIDDCPEDREAYRRVVRTWLDPVYAVSEATSADEGLELLRTQPADCILLDMDGLEFLQALGSMNDGPGPPVVMLTGAGSESVAVEAMKRGASDYLIKGSTNGETLQLAVHNAVEKAALQRQLTEKAAELSRANEALRHLATHEDREFRISISAGISIFPRDATDCERLISNADAALYAAKQMGRSTSQFYTEDLSARAIERRALEKQLREALEQNQSILHYQPQIDTNTDDVIGVEALIRWIHPELGLMPPNVFIPVAEQTGLIEPIDEWVIRRACEHAGRMRRAGFPALRVAVNLSVQQLRHRDLIHKIDEALEASEMDPSLLELEITETGVMKDFERSTETLCTLKSRDIRIAIDDFGTGHSSLNYLKRLPADSLKIDRSFVRELQPASSDEAIVAMAGSVRLQTIAAGVETPEQLALLRANDCFRMQGFFFGRPMPLEEVEGWLRARASGGELALAASAVSRG